MMPAFLLIMVYFGIPSLIVPQPDERSCLINRQFMENHTDAANIKWVCFAIASQSVSHGAIQ